MLLIHLFLIHRTNKQNVLKIFHAIFSNFLLETHEPHYYFTFSISYINYEYFTQIRCKRGMDKWRFREESSFLFLILFKGDDGFCGLNIGYNKQWLTLNNFPSRIYS